MSETTVILPERKLVRFRLGGEHFALPVESVTSIIRWREVTPLPNVPDHLLGLGNLRGRTLPVTDLRLKLGMDSEVAIEDGYIVVTENNFGQVGLLVDGVEEVLTVTEESIDASSADLSPNLLGLIDGLVNSNDCLVSLLNVDAILQVTA
jgi:purine-binding chemotaxis protein CheW